MRNPSEVLLLGSEDGTPLFNHGSRFAPITQTGGRAHVIPYYWNTSTLSYQVATQGGSGVGQEVKVTNFPATQAISAASLPLPTGAATEATLSSVNTKLPTLAARAINTQVQGTDPGLITNSVIHGKTTAGGGSYVDVKVNPSGALEVEATAGDTFPISIDGGNVDSFGRVRVSQATTLFNAQLTYDLQPLLLEPNTNGSGATITHDSTNRCALMTFSSTPTGGKAYFQSYDWIRYEPGKSQMVFLTFNFIEAKANCLKFVGIGDGTDGIEFRHNGTTFQWVILSSTTNGNQTKAQADWSLDTLDGNGASGINLEITKTHIAVIDFQALYVGRVRVGFDIGGTVVYCHEFLHANVAATPYIKNANLPIRGGMTCTGTVSTTMRVICMSVQSEAGQDDTVGYKFSSNTSLTAGNGTRTHAISVRPLTTFNSIANRSKLSIEDIDVLVTGTNPVLWELCIGQALTGTSDASANATYSAAQVRTGGSLSGSPAIVIDGGYASGSASIKVPANARLTHRYPITLNEAGAQRDLGQMTLLLTGIGGTSACQVSISWKEIR